ncbi:unnamed protein product [Protopolystoma xenopodis]|uniref:Uncharacterized protein n=1 Tax=Protopolystoma xenopodis TaxID=117903 RepID=A0A3S4ZUA6_9PLAT|nr:unnamed protein product [Protopolystoma xenopodis]
MILLSVEQAIAQGWYKPWQAHDPKLQQAYQHRFVDSILKVIEAEESSGHQMYPPTNPSSLIFHPRPILLSSPSNAAGGDGRTFDSLYDPQDPRYGDVHFYKYDGDLWSETIYPVSRMTTEFGIQSLPNPLAWRRSIPKVQHTDPSRWLPHGHLVDHREHQDNGLNNMYLPAYRVIGRPLPVHNPVENYTR